MGTNLYSLTLFCFLSVFWLYLGFILSVADLLLVSDSVCVGVGEILISNVYCDCEISDWQVVIGGRFVLVC